MILEVDPTDPTPVYEQIRAQIVYMVAAGTLTAGTRLPTIRQLAADVGLAKGTVARAYETLLRDGVVKAAGRNGTIIAASQTPDAPQREAQLRDAARRFAVRTRQLDIDPTEAVAAFKRALDEFP